MKILVVKGLVLLSVSPLLGLPAQAQLDPNWLGHDRLRPLPPVVNPATPGTQSDPGRPPGDAVVLFDGKDLSGWVAMNGEPTRWIVREGAMECVPGSDYIRTLQCFGDCQFHVEFSTPVPPEGSSQGRGNSGVFFGGGRYEIQVLDSYENDTYADGSCASIYNQYPPLVNASRPPGEWQTYDGIYTAPRFDGDGALLSPARITLFHNGVLVQNNVELAGNTGWLNRGPYEPHSEKQPLAFQDHGNPVRYRNIWLRELGRPSRPEFRLADALLDRYCGTYEIGRNNNAEIRRSGGNLLLRFNGVDFLMFATSPTRFFAKTIDIQAAFDITGPDPTVQISIGEEGGMRAKKIR